MTSGRCPESAGADLCERSCSSPAGQETHCFVRGSWPSLPLSPCPQKRLHDPTSLPSAAEAILLNKLVKTAGKAWLPRVNADARELSTATAPREGPSIHRSDGSGGWTAASLGIWPANVRTVSSIPLRQLPEERLLAVRTVITHVSTSRHEFHQQWSAAMGDPAEEGSPSLYIGPDLFCTYKLLPSSAAFAKPAVNKQPSRPSCLLLTRRPGCSEYWLRPSSANHVRSKHIPTAFWPLEGAPW